MIREITRQLFERDNTNLNFRIFIVDCKKILKDSDCLTNIEKYLGGKLFLMDQVHSDKISIIDSGSKNFIECDALITKDNILIGVQTADCIPVVIIEGNKRCVVHAGWRGLQKNIISSVLSNFDNPKIFIGPHIGNCCYEINVGDDSDGREKEFISKYGKKALVYRDSKYYLDLLFVLKQQTLSTINVETQSLDICTCCSNFCLPSHYRDGDKRNNIILTVLDY